MMTEVLIYLLIGWNLVVFLMYGFDKNRAIRDGRRISEKNLISVAFLMGGIGALLGMRVFRHKTRHRNFQVLVPLGLMMNVGVLVVLLLLSGCQMGGPANPNEPGEPQEPLHPEGAVALLINRPTEEERQLYKPLGNLLLQESEEGFLFVAIREDTDLEVMEIEMQEDGTLKELGSVYQVVDAPVGFALEITAIRPEGAPSYKLLIQTGDQEEVTYYISYNGKDGNPKEEYVFKK